MGSFYKNKNKQTKSLLATAYKLDKHLPSKETNATSQEIPRHDSEFIWPVDFSSKKSSLLDLLIQEGKVSLDLKPQILTFEEQFWATLSRPQAYIFHTLWKVPKRLHALVQRPTGEQCHKGEDLLAREIHKLPEQQGKAASSETRHCLRAEHGHLRRRRLHFIPMVFSKIFNVN